jgi:hypothetical protein
VWLEVGDVEQVQLAFFNAAGWVEGSDVAGVEVGREQVVVFGGSKVLFEQAEMGRTGVRVHAVEAADAEELFWVEGSIFALFAFDSVEWIGGNEDRVAVGISGDGPLNDRDAEFFVGIVVSEASEPAVEDLLAGSKVLEGEADGRGGGGVGDGGGIIEEGSGGPAGGGPLLGIGEELDDSSGESGKFSFIGVTGFW